MNACIRRLALVGILFGTVLLTSCSTITPYPLDVSKQSQYFGNMTPDLAVDIIKHDVSISGEEADYRSFLVDEQGFSYAKTTEKTRTEWKDGKAKEYKSSSTSTRHVPWTAITEIEPFMEHYNKVFSDRYRVRVKFKITSVKYGQRSHDKEDLEFNCKDETALADVVAAVRFLSKN